MRDQPGDDLGLQVRNLRRLRGLTQRELAARAGISLGAVRDLEQGRSSNPRPRFLEALCDVLGLSDAQRNLLRRRALPGRPEPVRPSGPASVSVLGPLSVSRPAGHAELGAGRHRAVLARLALTPRHPVAREELVHLLWGDDPPRSAANVVQTHVSRLRRILEPPGCRGDRTMLTSTPGGYRLQMDDEHLDLVRYRSRLAEGQRVSRTDPHRGFDLLSEALDMWTGRQAVEDVPELLDDPLVIALSDELVDATIRLADAGRMLRRLPEVLPRLRRLAAQHPWHESLHARLIAALAASGQQAAALGTYDEVRRRLAEELGIDPGAELAEARQSVLEGRDSGQRSANVTGGRTPVPFQAPAPPPDFTGRVEQLLQLEQLLVSTTRRSATQVRTVCVVSGMPGVGKTSLMLQAAQTSRSDFPDGQLYIDLRGAGHGPISVPDAVARLLRGLGVDGGGIPAEVEEACALYRSLLAERRVLVMLDNARSAAQIRPLLPGTGGSALLVTSRSRCAGLEGADHLLLPVLTVEESLDMLSRRLGQARVAADDANARALTEACGRLPVALRVIGSRLAARPEWTMRDLLQRLAGAPSRLAEFRVGDVAVTAGFGLSYQELAPRPAEAFRMASMLPGPDFSATAAAALLGADADRTARTLDDLVDENVLQSAGGGRYRYHDLIRLYAQQRMEAENGTGRSAALGRLAHWYLGRTTAAVRLVHAETVRLPAGVDDARMRFADGVAAMAWLDEEAGSLTAFIEAAAGGEHRDRAWQLADQMRGYFLLRRDVVSWLATGRAGLAAAESAGDLQAQAAMHLTIGQAHWSVGRHERARDAYRRGAAAARSSGWLTGAAYLSHNLGLAHAELSRVDDALLGQGAIRRSVAMATCADPGMTPGRHEQVEPAHDHLAWSLTHHRGTGPASGQTSVLDHPSQHHGQRGGARRDRRIAHHGGDR